MVFDIDTCAWQCSETVCVHPAPALGGEGRWLLFSWLRHKTWFPGCPASLLPLRPVVTWGDTGTSLGGAPLRLCWRKQACLRKDNSHLAMAVTESICSKIREKDTVVTLTHLTRSQHFPALECDNMLFYYLNTNSFFFLLSSYLRAWASPVFHLAECARLQQPRPAGIARKSFLLPVPGRRDGRQMWVSIQRVCEGICFTCQEIWFWWGTWRKLVRTSVLFTG